MLRCGRCGCRKFIFTTAGDEFDKPHGAICALCHKQLNSRDIRINFREISSTWPATYGDDTPVYHHPDKT